MGDIILSYAPLLEGYALMIDQSTLIEFSLSFTKNTRDKTCYDCTCKQR